jgi:hypothetical protein
MHITTEHFKIGKAKTGRSLRRNRRIYQTVEDINTSLSERDPPEENSKEMYLKVLLIN